MSADRELRIAAAVAARPEGVRLADAVADAVVEQYANAGEHEALRLIITRTALRDAFLDITAEIEHPLTAVIAERLDDAGAHAARVLAASVAVAVRIALEGWLQPPGSSEVAGAGGLVVPTGSLTDQLRAALAPLTPSFDAAERQSQS